MVSAGRAELFHAGLSRAALGGDIMAGGCEVAWKVAG
jgi:hypothetical protein